MKLKTIMLLSGICLFAACFFTLSYINSLKYSACDIIKINDLYKDVETDLNTIAIGDVEKKYDCRILLYGEEGYTNSLYEAVRNSDVIIDYMKGNTLVGKIVFPANSNSFLQMKRKLSAITGAAFAAIAIILYTAAFIVYRRILHPFKKLKEFAGNISNGNLELPLAMDRANYFGAFTESFDLMRDELKRAKQGEYEANISKKELVAELSHDIKTPVATIKALCELLEIKVKDEDTVGKLHIINQKADVIDRLISNLFHATLEELEVLKIEPKEELSTIIPPMLAGLNHYGRIHIRNKLPGCLIYCDKLRLNQVIDNIINNSYKYADTDIDVFYSESKNAIGLELRDYGSSMKEEELPLIFGKYFRGENAASQSGTGLGLYLAKQFMEGMKGGIECSCDGGFVVKLNIKKV
jgi:signal transduction histidine kinase